MENFSLLYPQNTFLFLFIPFFLLLKIISHYKKEKKINRLFNQEQKKLLISNSSPNAKKIQTLLQFASLTLLISITTGPQWKNQQPKTDFQKISVLLDVSASMLAEDVYPNRLEKAKLLLQQFLKKLTRQRISLVLFSSTAFIYAPLTTDYQTLNFFLHELSPLTLPLNGTKLQQGFEIALDTLKSDLDIPHKKKISTLIPTQYTGSILLLTDGETHNPNLSKIIKKLKRNNVAVFSIGLGTQKGSSIPQQSQQEKILPPLADPSGNTIISKLQKETIEDISTSTGGQAYFSPIENYHLADILDKIKNLLNNNPLLTYSSPKNQLPILPILLLLSLSIEICLLNYKKIL